MWSVAMCVCVGVCRGDKSCHSSAEVVSLAISHVDKKLNLIYSPCQKTFLAHELTWGRHRSLAMEKGKGEDVNASME